MGVSASSLYHRIRATVSSGAGGVMSQGRATLPRTTAVYRIDADANRPDMSAQVVIHAHSGRRWERILFSITSFPVPPIYDSVPGNLPDAAGGCLPQHS